MDHRQIPGLLQEHALNSPEKTAVYSEKQEINYKDLHLHVTRLSQVLKAIGLNAGHSAGIFLSPGTESVISLLTCLQTGITFQPLDAGGSRNLVMDMVNAMAPQVLITTKEHLGKVKVLLRAASSGIGQVLLLENGQPTGLYHIEGNELQEGQLPQVSSAESPETIQENFASHLHFSNDHKKVVRGSSRSLNHFVDWFTRTFELNAESRGIILHPMSSELSVLEVLATLSVGGTLYIPDSRSARSTDSLHKVLVSERTTWAFLTNDAFLSLADSNKGVLGLRMVFVGEGQPLPVNSVKKWHSTYGGRCRVVNTLVVPEATMFRTYKEITDSSSGDRPLPYGVPVDKSFTAILANGELCKPMQRGEIYIKTPLLSLGYADCQDAFIQNPLVQEKDLLFPTGLTGYYLRDRSIMPGDPAEHGAGQEAEVKYSDIPVLSEADDYPLSHAQKRLWLLDQMEQDFYAYNMFSGYEMEGDLDVPAFRKAFETLVERHEILRTTFSVRHGEPRQIIHDPRTFDFHVRYEDVRGHYSEEVVEEKGNAEVRYTFDMEKGPLFRATLLQTHDRKFVFMLVMHHIVSDGWSLNILVKEVLMLYDAYRHNLPSPLRPLRIQYKDYAVWQKNELEMEESDAHKAFWLNLFNNEVPVLDIPADYPRPLNKDYKGLTVGKSLTKEVADKLYQLSNRNGATLFMTLQAALDAFLYRYTGQSDITLVTPIAGRPHTDLEDQIGFYINMLPLRATFKGSDSFMSLLQQVRNTTFGAYEHQVYPFDKLIDDINLGRDMGRAPLSDICIVLQNTSNTNDNEEIAGVEVDTKGFSADVSKYDLTWTFSEMTDGIYFTVNYATSLFSKERIEAMMDLFSTMVTAMAETPEGSIDRFPIMGDKEAVLVTQTFNPPSKEYPREKSVPALFAEQVSMTPEHTALVYEDQKYTYEQLHDLSDRLAAYLQSEYNVQKGESVALLFDRNDHLIISILAVLKAGAVYVPVDPKFPDSRKQFILEDADCKTLISQSGYMFDMPYFTGNMFATDIQMDMLEEGRVTDPGLEAVDPAYVMFTSGSTGQPKGAVIPHRAIVRLVRNTNYVEFSETSRLLLTGAISFDATTFEIWGMLLNGGTLYVISDDSLTDPVRLKDAIHQHEVNTLWMTAGYFNQLVDEDYTVFKPVKQLVSGGERMSPPHVNKIRELLPGLTVINGYGPTENTTFSICHRVEETYRQDVPLGKPVSHSTAYILDNHLNPVPVGVPGEICLGGDGLALGYLNNQELTDAKFVDNPFSEGEKLYRTGDLGRWTAEGIIEFMGRKDFQVKIRGFRVELGAVEAAIEEVQGVHEKIVIVRQDKSGIKQLIAYFTAEEDLATDAIKVHLQQRLPEYAVPARFVRLERMPLNNNGKVDRRKLPEPEEMQEEKVFVEPKTGMEKALAAIWFDVLEVNRISADDNFFDIGGHSLKATQVISRLHKQLNVKVDLRDIFNNPVLAELAAVLEKNAPAELSEIKKAELSRHYPMSHAQRRLWMVDQIEEENSAYNMPIAYRLSGDIDPAILERAFRNLVERHQSLRTVFVTIEGEGYQEVRTADEMPFTLHVTDLSHETDAEGKGRQLIRDEAKHIFNLEEGPLFRVNLYEIGNGEHFLLLNMHHIISDGWSLEVLAREMFVMYQAFAVGNDSPLEPLNIQYHDYAQWHNSEVTGDKGESLKKFWMDTLSGDIPVLELPADYPRPKRKTYEGDMVKARASSEILEGLERLAKKEGTTLFTVLTACTKALLYRYTGQHDIILGTAVAGRDHADLEDQIGFYVNTLPLRSKFSGSDSITALINKEKDVILEAFRHQAYPLDQMVESLILTPDLSRSPLFDAFIVLQNNKLKKEVDGIDDVEITPLSEDLEMSKYDIEFNYAEGSDGKLNIAVSYRTALFSKPRMERMLKHLFSLLQNVLVNPAQPLSHIALMDEEEKAALRNTYNPVSRDIPEGTLHGLFSAQAQKTPDAPALITADRTYTYGELEALTNKVGNYLLANYDIQPDDIVALISPRTPEAIIALIGILKAGAAYVPVNSDDPADRIRFILHDTRCRVAVTSASASVQPSGNIAVLSVKELIERSSTESNSLPGSHTQPHHLAYVIYTSGTTGTPKGVLLEHRNVTPRIGNREWAFTFRNGERLLSTTALTFDPSVKEIFAPLIQGGAYVYISEEQKYDVAFVKNVLLKEQVSKIHVTTGLFNQLLDQDPAVFDTVHTIVIGGDRASSSHIVNLLERHKDLVFYNAYGPTENAIFSTFTRVENVGSKEISIGKPAQGASAYILDKNMQPVPVGVTGELYLGGDGVARGYLNRDELTAQKFLPDPYSDRPNARMYRSGDLAQWTEDGEIMFIGRLDNQLKIRGYRVELGEVENALASLTELKDALVQPVTDPMGLKQLVAYIIPEGEASVAAIKSALARTLPEYMIPLYYVTLANFPLTSNGKVDRKALPVPDDLQEARPYLAPKTRMEKALAAIWHDVLDAEQISADDNFFSLGGHSVRATQVVSRVYKQLQARIALKDIFNNPTLIELAAFIEKSNKTAFSGIEPTEEREYYPLSHAQKRLWLLDQIEDELTAYNIPMAFALEGPLDLVAFSKAFDTLIGRHESLRTTFVSVEGRGMQKINSAEDFAFTVKVKDLREHTDKEAEAHAMLEAESQKVFDLENGPLVSALVIRMENELNYLLVNMHHIISDGWSLEVITREIFTLYQAYMSGHHDPLPDLRIQYRDYSVWQQNILEEEENQVHRDYWLSQFSEEVPVLELPADHPRPKVKTYAGEYAHAHIGPELAKKLHDYSNQHGASLFMTLIAGLDILFYRYTGQTDITLGTAIAGRDHADLEDQVGFYVNTLALRSRFEGHDSMDELLEKVKNMTFQAYSHQMYPYDRLINDLGLEQDRSRSPLFDVMVVLQNAELKEGEVSSFKGIQVRPLAAGGNDASQFDLSITFQEDADGIGVAFNFNTDIYDKGRIQRMVRHFVNLMQQAMEEPDQAVSSLTYLSESERSKVSDTYAKPAADIPHSTIQQLFSDQATRTPENTAIVYGQDVYTYTDLEVRSNKLGHWLKNTYHIQPGDVVAIMLPRNAQSIVTLLGILKSGAAYVPLDPDYPAERVDFIIKDTACKTVVTTRQAVEGKSFDATAFTYLEDISAEVQNQSGALPDTNAAESDLAYLIYTSGSTGTPKGVMVEHRNVLPRLINPDLIRVEEKDKFLSTTSLTFDPSIWDIFVPLLHGASLTVIPHEDVLNAGKMKDTIRNQNINKIHMPAGLFHQLMDQDPTLFDGVEFLKMGGERLSIHHTAVLLDRNKEIVLVNAYGPTENAIYSTYQKVSEPYTTDIPIGKPAPGTAVYILDENLRPVGPGIRGEIYLAGAGVARGYLNRDELTEANFITDPFSGKEGGRMYRTGDFGRWNDKGEVEFFGRGDDQVKVRGFRIELGEIELALRKLDKVRDAVVNVVEDDRGLKQLAAYVIPEGSVSHDELKTALGTTLPDYMVPLYFVDMEVFPLTSSSKVDRKALPAPALKADGPKKEAVSESEKLLLQIWKEELKLDSIGINENFFFLGGHSLKATNVVTKVFNQAHVKIRIKDIFQYPTIEELASLIDSGEKHSYVSIQPISGQEHYPLSHAQRRLWILNQFEDEQNAYNMPNSYGVDGDFDYDAFRKAVQAWVDRHEINRTIFVEVDGQPRQKVYDQLEVNVELIDLRAYPEEEAEAIAKKAFSDEANSAFDLITGPLHRFKLVRITDSRSVVIINIHHIISDGWSIGVMVNELLTLYNAFRAGQPDPLPPMKLQYKDYAAWHNGLVANNSFNEHEAYWMEKFGDRPNGIELPVDNARSAIQTFNGGRKYIRIDKEKTDKLKALGMETNATLFMTILSVIDVLLYKYSGQQDIMIGAPVAGRRQPELYDICGFLVNTLVYRVDVNPDESFVSLLKKVREDALESYEHQDYPFDLMIEKLELDRDLSQSPIFNVMIAHNNTETQDQDMEIDGAQPAGFDAEGINMAKFDMTFFLIDTPHGDTVLDLEYNSDLFNRESIERMAENFNVLVQSICDSPEDPVRQLNLISDKEKDLVQNTFNASDCELPAQTIQEQFEQQVEKTPDSIAIVWNDETITYAELNERANQLAHFLRETYDISKGHMVGLSMDRSIELVTAIIGIIKSGAGYVAIDPTYPQDRVTHMLKDSECNYLLVDKERPGLFDDFHGEIINLTLEEATISWQEFDNPENINSLDDILYVIYTSGSTGTPNGAMLSQGILSNLIEWQKYQTDIDGSLRCLQFTSVNFCVSFQEIFSTLTTGGELHLIGEMERQDIEYLMNFLVEHQIEALYLPFSYLNFLFNESGKWTEDFNHNLKHIITAGEQLKVTHGLKRFLDQNPHIRLHNHYGSSEMHVVTSYTLDASTAEKTPVPPAGAPVANTRIYVLDEDRNPVPVGAYGELCIRGSHEVAGYINNDELSDRKLYDHPEFSDGIRLYCSGDVGRWNADGFIEMKGRKDSQVKIRGFRVELGEVESKIFSMDEVKDCVVVVKEDPAGQKFLVSYVVLEGADIPEIKRFVSHYLPQYMVPKFVKLDALPLMHNGKVDRAALPEPTEDEITTRYEAPVTETQKVICGIWEEVLKSERVGIKDNFFEKGGHSLKATQVTARIHKELGIKVELIHVFTHPTVEDLAGVIDEMKSGNIPQAHGQASETMNP